MKYIYIYKYISLIPYFLLQQPGVRRQQPLGQARLLGDRPPLMQQRPVEARPPRKRALFQQQHLVEARLPRNRPPLKHRKKSLVEKDLLTDVDVPGIYIKKWEAGEGHKFHACVFCGELKERMQPHLKHEHEDEPAVLEIKELKRKLEENAEDLEIKAKLKQRQESLRYEGDHFHNEQVLQHNHGELLIPRREKDMVFRSSEYMPCQLCHMWLPKATCLKTKHLKVCNGPSQYH